MNETGAGTLLRTAREANGLSLAALAASLKVTQSKLEALEADRIDLLPDATFARALAQTMCKALKIDAAPVLAALPAGRSHRLEQLGEGINAPFRDRGDRPLARALGSGGSLWIWAAGLVAAATALVVLAPTAWWSAMRSERAAAASADSPPAASTPPADALVAESTRAAVPELDGGASAPATSGSPPSTETVAIRPSAVTASSVRPAIGSSSTAAGSAPSATADVAGAGPLRLNARAESWVEVVDAQGRTLISRTLAAGEQVALDGSAPLKLKIGNAVGTDVVFRGAPVDLVAKTKDNVARLEIAR